MEKETKTHFNEQMRKRTTDMAYNVRCLFQPGKISLIDRPMVSQLLRCSSSVAANCRAATRARSDQEFYSKICIVTEECDEAQFWIEYLVRIGVLNEQETLHLRTEVGQLVRIFTSIKKKMRERLQM